MFKRKAYELHEHRKDINWQNIPKQLERDGDRVSLPLYMSGAAVSTATTSRMQKGAAYDVAQRGLGCSWTLAIRD